jgi:hypothetical protein
MNATTARHRLMTCPHCKTEQRLHLLAVPEKLAVLIPKQTVLCVECGHGFYLLNDAKIVGAPFAV